MCLFSQRKTLKKVLVVGLTAVLVMASVGLLPATAQQAQSNKDVVIVSSDEQVLMETVNGQRIDHGLAPLSWNEQLYQAAHAKADHLFQEQYFDHIAPDGTTPWAFFRAANYTYKSAGENLAIDFSTLTDAVPAWMNSPSHRANILNPDFTDTAMAVVYGHMDGQETTAVVQLFGEPMRPFLALK